MRANKYLRRVMLLGVASATIVAAGCSSSKSEPQSQSTAPQSSAAQSTASQSSVSQPAAPQASGTSVADTVNAAKALLQKYADPPAFEPPGPPVDASKVKNKKILAVLVNTNGTIATIANGIKEAGAAAGLQVSIFNANNVLSAMTQGIQNGINQHVDAILLPGIVTNLVTPAIKAAHDAGIPLIGLTDANPVNGVPGQGNDPSIFGMAALPFEELGKVMAAKAIADSDGKDVNAVILVWTSPVADAAAKGIKEGLAGCSFCHVVETKNIPLANWGTQATPTIAAMIQRDPSINYIFPVVDPLAIFAVPAVQQANAVGRVKIISQGSGSAGDLKLVQAGGPFIFDAGSSPEWTGWLGVDQALRAMSGMEPGNPVQPFFVIDTETLKGKDLANYPDSVFPDDFKTGFKKLWGVG